VAGTTDPNRPSPREFDAPAREFDARDAEFDVQHLPMKIHSFVIPRPLASEPTSPWFPRITAR
jgi:hypothetical protein